MAGGTGGLQVERSKRGKAGKRKKKKRVGFRLDMTPLVDITMLLLTFFMFTTTMATPQIMEMSMPPEFEDVEVKDVNLMTVRVRADGIVFWNIGKDDPEKISIKDLRKVAERENLKEGKRNELITCLKIDDNAPFALAITILDELNLAEVRITADIIKENDKDGKPLTRKRRFTMAPMLPEDLELIQNK